MNPPLDLVGLSLPLVLGGLLWLYGFRLHRYSAPASIETIRLPRVMGLLFGSVRTDGALNLRGILSQLSAYTMWPILSLGFGGVIPRDTAITCFVWLGTILGLFSLVLVVREWRQRRKP